MLQRDDGEQSAPNPSGVRSSQALWKLGAPRHPRPPPLPVHHTGEPPVAHGEVSVQDPQQIHDGLRKYITYKVAGSYPIAGVGSFAPPMEFTSRKRYSDFEWLRNALRLRLPGAALLPLPRKQHQGRFEAAFIEERASGLQKFLSHLFLARGLLREGSLLVRFLACPEGAMDQLKQEFGLTLNVGEMYREYCEVFVAELQARGAEGQERGRSQGPDEASFAATQNALTAHVQHLTNALACTTQMCSNKRKEADAAALVHHRLSTLREDDRWLCEPAADARAGLVSALAQYSAVCAANPTNHFDQLSTMLAQELQHAGAIQDALTSILDLQSHVDAIKKRIADGASTQARLVRRHQEQEALQAPGQPPMMARKRDMILNAIDNIRGGDPVRQLESVNRQLEKDTQDVIAGEQWVNAAHKVLTEYELNRFFMSKVELQRTQQHRFLSAMAQDSQHIAEMWAHASAECPSPTELSQPSAA